MQYDFHRQLEWMDFQNLARDVIQIREGILFESFKEGRDSGIDGRFCNDKGTVILQAKRYGEYKTLRKSLKEESKKVRKLHPERYILVVSLPLTEGQKDELMQLFQGYIKQTGDLVSSDDLNNYLSHPQYACVIRNYPKLWAAGGIVLQELVREAINNSVEEESRQQLILTKEARETFVATRIYHNAVDMLEKQNCVVISGQPGAGKSTLARIIALYYIEIMHFEKFIWTTSSVEKLMSLYVSEQKQVFVIDDIWGQVFYAERKHDQEMSYLEQLLFRIKRDKNKILIITTREYIYQQATAKHSVIRSIIERYKLICHVDTYTDAEKAGILFSHLNNANLAAKYIWPIYFRTEEIVEMPDYNPRIIDLFLQNNDPWNDTPYEFVERFIKNIRNPFTFWEDIFSRLTKEARLLALIAFISQGEMEPVGMEDLEKTYYHCLSHVKNPLENTRNYFACISELEKTIIRVDTYYSNSDEKVLRFRTPAAQDFLLKHMKENIGYYGPVLLDGVCYLNQLIFLMDADKIHLSDELYMKALHLFIKRFKEWDFSWPFEADENYTSEGEKAIKSSELYRCTLLLPLHEKRPKIESFNFLASTIKRYRSMLKRQPLSYADMMVYPALVTDCKNIGVIFENEETVVEEYFRSCFLATHYYIMCNFGKEFANAVSRLLQQNKRWFRTNLEELIWETVNYFETHGMYTELDTMLEIEIVSIFKFLGVRYTQRFYKELAGELDHHVAMPDSLQEKYNKKLHASHQKDKWKKLEKQMEEKEIQLRKVIDQEWEIIVKKHGIWLEEDQQIQRVLRGTFSPAIKKQLLKVIGNGQPVSIARFLENKIGIDLLEILLQAANELPLPESHFLTKLTKFFFAKCPCKPRDLYDVFWQIAKWDSDSSLERILFEKELVEITKGENPLDILEHLQKYGIIRISERLVHFEQVFPAHLLLVHQIINASKSEEKTALYKRLREEKVWNNLEFISLAIPMLANLDTESFYHYYFCIILQEFEKETMEEQKHPFLFFKRLEVEFDFSEEDREFPSSSIKAHELLTVLECMDLFFHDELIPVDFAEKLDSLPIVEGLERIGDKYFLKIALLEEQFIKAWGFADTSASFFTLLEQIKEYLISTSYKRKISLEVLGL